MSQPVTHLEPTTVGELFAHAFAAKDSTRICSLLSDPVDFEALTPRRHWVASRSREVVDEVMLKHWIRPDDDVRELRSVTVGQVADRERVSYRLGIRREGQDYVFEQQAYYASDGQRITWIRILCSGYRPEEPPLVLATQ